MVDAAEHAELLPPALRLGEVVPDFEAVTTQGPVKLSSFGDGWVILFSYLANFTPVCATEFLSLAEAHPEFERRHCRILALGGDSLSSHIAWIRDLESISGRRIPFPVIADAGAAVLHALRLDEPNLRGEANAQNATLFLDGQSVLRAMLFYPSSVGRSIPEMLRILDAVQLADVESVDTPADWQPGERPLVPSPRTQESADRRMEEDFDCQSWYLCRARRGE
jgi:peroxiredoxin 2/4